MRLKNIPIMLAASVLSFAAPCAVFDAIGGGAAFADSENGNGGGNGNGNGGAEKAASKSIEKSVVKDEIAPSKPGKMNGALNANINAVLAHIRNGQTTNGPIGLLAGLAIADSSGTTAAAEAAALQEVADGFDALDGALTGAGFASVEAYLAAKTAGTATEAQIAAIEPLIEAVGGLNTEATDLAQVAPTAEEIQAALDAATAAAADIAAAELAIAEAWNKEGDLPALLVALREKLALHEAVIAAALAGA